MAQPLEMLLSVLLKITWDTHTFSLMPSFLRLRHISVVLICCSVSLANRKRSFSSLGAADAQAALPKRCLSSSICFTIPEHTHDRSNVCVPSSTWILTNEQVRKTTAIDMGPKLQKKHQRCLTVHEKMFSAFCHTYEFHYWLLMCALLSTNQQTGVCIYIKYDWMLSSLRSIPKICEIPT